MTFIEALKANETEDVYSDMYGDYYNKGTLKYSKTPVIDMMVRSFCVKPKLQVFEFECNWIEQGIYIIPFRHSDGPPILEELKSMSGRKRWRVRCEEII